LHVSVQFLRCSTFRPLQLTVARLMTFLSVFMTLSLITEEQTQDKLYFVARPLIVRFLQFSLKLFELFFKKIVVARVGRVPLWTFAWTNYKKLKRTSKFLSFPFLVDFFLSVSAGTIFRRIQ